MGRGISCRGWVMWEIGYSEPNDAEPHPRGRARGIWCGTDLSRGGGDPVAFRQPTTLGSRLRGNDNLMPSETVPLLEIASIFLVVTALLAYVNQRLFGLPI